MSIWSSFGGAEPLYEVGYAWDPGDVDPKSGLDLAESLSFYGRSAIRVSIDSSEGHSCAVLSREQVTKTVRQLQAWLAAKEES
jgi:hypothetical protein